MPDEDLVNALAQYLEFEPVEKQALLERDGLLDRCRSLIELLEMKVLVARHTWDRQVVTLVRCLSVVATSLLASAAAPGGIRRARC